jgi:hypothetical protein
MPEQVRRDFLLDIYSVYKFGEGLVDGAQVYSLAGFKSAYYYRRLLPYRSIETRISF